MGGSASSVGSNRDANGGRDSVIKMDESTIDHDKDIKILQINTIEHDLDHGQAKINFAASTRTVAQENMNFMMRLSNRPK